MEFCRGKFISNEINKNAEVLMVVEGGVKPLSHLIFRGLADIKIE